MRHKGKRDHLNRMRIVFVGALMLAPFSAAWGIDYAAKKAANVAEQSVSAGKGTTGEQNRDEAPDDKAPDGFDEVTTDNNAQPNPKPDPLAKLADTLDEDAGSFIGDKTVINATSKYLSEDERRQLAQYFRSDDGVLRPRVDIYSRGVLDGRVLEPEELFSFLETYDKEILKHIKFNFKGVKVSGRGGVGEVELYNTPFDYAIIRYNKKTDELTLVVQPYPHSGNTTSEYGFGLTADKFLREKREELQEQLNVLIETLRTAADTKKPEGVRDNARVRVHGALKVLSSSGVEFGHSLHGVQVRVHGDDRDEGATSR